MKEFSTLKKVKAQLSANPYKLSIGIRLKNEIKAIEDFYNSLQKQTFFPFLEVVFLDSGSTDGTLAYLEKLNCTIYTIAPSEFSFGETCNLIMQLTTCDLVCLFSGHVILENENMLEYSYNYINEAKKPLSGYYRQVPNPKLGCSIYDSVFLKYNFVKFNTDKPVLQGKGARFSNAASLIARAHWQQVKFKDVIASEDALWADEVVDKFGNICYFHMFNVLHSHKETYADVKKRVSINAKVRYPNGVGLIKRSYMFSKVFVALFFNSGSLVQAIRFAYAHSSAYNASNFIKI